MHRRTLHLYCAFALVLLPALPATLPAHEGHRVFGIIESFENGMLQVKDRQGRVVQFAVDENSRLECPSTACEERPLIVGRRVVAFLTGDHRRALRLRLGPRPGPSPDRP